MPYSCRDTEWIPAGSIVGPIGSHRACSAYGLLTKRSPAREILRSLDLLNEFWQLDTGGL